MSTIPQTKILTRVKELYRKPLEEIDEDKIVFYDWETDHQYGIYAKPKAVAVQYGFKGEPETIKTKKQRKKFRRALADPEVIKVDFNGVNFDRIVGFLHGYPVHPQNAHDVFQIFKTISPSLPAFSQKFISFFYLADPHFPEHELEVYMQEHNCAMYEVPPSILNKYNRHDIKQLVNLFRLAWDVVIRDEYWEGYLNSMLIYEPYLEMATEGGMYLDKDQVWRELQRLQKIVQVETKEALVLTGGRVTNPNSSHQLGEYFTKFDNLEIELTQSGEFSVKKSVLVALKDDNPLANCAFNIRSANGSIKYMENYLNALDDETYEETVEDNWIPIQYSWDAAGTRRVTSQSLYRLNFQNPNELAKSVQIVPPGQLGWWLDATQIENVVHIYESGDTTRRAAYESDEDWNEYVWLCNTILRTDKTKEELDDKENSRSPQIPNWTIYKQYKTGKLAINFGMGIDKFCVLFGLSRDVGEIIFHDIHSACPAIHGLQRRVARDLRADGFVSDVFQKRYSGLAGAAYKVVAYLIQGCGTGSLPKAQIRANWETLRRFDKYMPSKLAKRGCKCGVMCTTTHDENGGRISLRLDPGRILQLLQKLHYNMTERFSYLFDDIPLRAKLYLSKTTASKAIECDIRDTEKIATIILGSPCPACAATGKIKKDKVTTKCRACKSYGYRINN